MLTGKRYPREEIEGFIEHLATKYPAAFFLDPKQKRPLKKNITLDLERDGTLDADRREAAVGFYTRDWCYERCLQAGVKRVDLNGKPVGTVTEQEQLEARKRVEQQKAERRERQQRERQALEKEKTEATVLPAFVTRPTNGHAEPESKVCVACGETFTPHHHIAKILHGGRLHEVPETPRRAPAPRSSESREATREATRVP
jgi:sRNA-binding protein